MAREILGTVLGLLAGVGTGVGLCVAQSEPWPLDGRRVVAWVYKNQVVETSLAGRCLVVGVGLGVLGGITGCHLGRGGGIVPAAVVSLLAVWLAHSAESLFPPTRDTAGANTRIVGLVFVGYLGAAAGARASLNVRGRERRANGTRF